MEHLIKLFLDQPHRLEKLAINLLRFSITSWVLTFSINALVPFFGIDDLHISINWQNLSGNSFYEISLYFVLFIFTWILLWNCLAQIFIPALIQLIGFLVKWSLFFVFRSVYFFVLILIKPFGGKKSLPRFMYISIDDDYFDNNYSKFNSEINIILKGIEKMNKMSNSSFGSEVFLEIINYEKTDLINSRIQQYYAAVLFVYLGFWLKYGVSGFEVYYYSLLLFLLQLGALVFFIDYILSATKNVSLYKIKEQLEYSIYQEMVGGAIEEDRILREYTLTKKRRIFTLSLKEKFNELSNSQFQNILITPVSVYPLDFVLSKILEEEQDKETTLYIIISDQLPDVAMRNLLEERNIFFIFGEDEEEVLRGIDEIRHFIYLSSYGEK